MDDAFAKDGDSGAWVLGANGVLLGLLWGRSGAGGCYVTPTTAVLQDISKHLNVDISLL